MNESEKAHYEAMRWYDNARSARERGLAKFLIRGRFKMAYEYEMKAAKLAQDDGERERLLGSAARIRQDYEKESNK